MIPVDFLHSVQNYNVHCGCGEPLSTRVLGLMMHYCIDLHRTTEMN